MNLSWLKGIAPTVAAALGGPLAGLAVEAVGSAFGWSETTREKVEATLTAGQLNGDQLLALKQAELALLAREKEMGFRFAELDASDRKDARSMQVANKSFMPALLSAIVTLGYLAILAGMMVGWLQTQDSQALLIMLGSLSTGWGVVLSFWFGTTRNSEDKTRLLAQAPPVTR